MNLKLLYAFFKTLQNGCIFLFFFSKCRMELAVLDTTVWQLLANAPYFLKGVQKFSKQLLCFALEAYPKGTVIACITAVYI